MFSLSKSFGDVPKAASPVFMCLRCLSHFLRYQGRRVTFSCFALPDSFWAILPALGPVFMFCAPGLVWGGTEGVGSHLHVLPSQTRFRQYRDVRTPFSFFCAPEFVFSGTEGIGVPFSCFALPDSFHAVPRASGTIFKFCAPGLIFDGTEGVGSRLHVLRSQTLFRQYRGCRIQFSCFALPDSFGAVPSVSGPVFIFYAPILVFEGTEGVRSRFHVLRSRTLFRR
jgi:hypothetical protein